MGNYILKWRKPDGSVKIENFSNLSDVTERMKKLSEDKIEFQVIFRV